MHIYYTPSTGQIQVLADDPLTSYPGAWAHWDAPPPAAPFSTFSHYVSDNDPDTLILVAIPPAPQGVLGHVWDWASHSWVAPTLAEVRKEVVSRAKRERDRRIFDRFAWDGSLFDSDETAQSRLVGLFVSSLSPLYTPTAWRLYDNSWRVLSAVDVAGVWAALQSHLRSHFEAFALHEVQINASVEPENYNYNDGWPV